MAELTLTALKVILEISQRGSFSAAGDGLGYTQSAISRQVAAAEAAIAAPIFDRRPRGVELTAVGEVLVRHAKRIVNELAAAEFEIAGARDKVAGVLAVGAFPLAASSLVPRAIALLKQRHPGLVIELHEAGSPTQMRWMRSTRIEVALVGRGEGLPAYDFTGLEIDVLPPTPLGVAICLTHPLAQRDELELADIADELWVVGTGSGPQFLAWPTLSEPRIAYRVGGWHTRLGIVAAGLAITVIPEGGAHNVPRNVTWVKVNDPALRYNRESVIVTHPNPSPAAVAFRQALHQVMSK